MMNDKQPHQRLIRSHDEITSMRSGPTTAQSSDADDGDSLKLHDHIFGQKFTMALTIAGMGLGLLVTIFSLFHVEMFLRVYRLPLHVYSTGNLIFTVINTFNDLLGAYILDAAATRMNRSDLIGISGCTLAMFFLSPFFRWKDPSRNEIYDQAHFVLSISMYDTLYSFTAILLGSLVTDNHHLTDKERVNFMASGKILNLFASFFVAKIGLEIFETNDINKFRIFLVTVALFVAVIFLVSQMMIHYQVVVYWKSMRIRFLRSHKRRTHGPRATARLKPKQVIQDFWGYNNFWAWVGMELLLESQMSFSDAFLKTFVDQLLHDEGVSREGCDWLLSIVRPLGLICTILCYIPIRRLGYKNIYPVLFSTNIVLCSCIWLGASHKATGTIISFLIVYPAITTAVATAGFHLVMSDMVLEMKKMHLAEGRQDEASLAALFMGVNALFCKPAESILPIIAAYMLDKLDLTSDGNEDVQQILFKLLVIPPLVFSVLEWISWRRFTLTPTDTRQMREELRKMESRKRLVSDDEVPG
mmetsp:Transcript_16064/g.44424  ORF Transcript_16064/g.44424 Transcript_16064/m.44424 type:complete len:529 (-) Transcript_16064:148-1734(-)